MIGINLRRNLWLSLLPILCCSLFFVSSSPAQAQKAGKLIVKITGIRNAEGNIRIAVRTDETTIAAAQIATIDAKTLTAQAVFDNLPEGDYGVAVVHDENQNAKLDFNETKFVVSAPGTTITVNLIYWP